MSPTRFLCASEQFICSMIVGVESKYIKSESFQEIPNVSAWDQSEVSTVISLYDVSC